MSHNLQKTHSVNATKARANSRAAKEQAPRYEVRFNNGLWVIFDTHAYRPVEVVRPNLYKAAVELLNA